MLLDKLVALGGVKPECVGAAFQGQKKFGAVVVFPCAGVDRAAAQADEDGHVLDADRTLELAGAAGGALEGGLLGVVFAEQRFLRRRAEIVQVGAQAEDDLFGVEQLAGVRGGAVLGAAAALHAGVGLQADQSSEVGAGDEAEVLIADEWRNLAEAAARKKDGERAQQQVQVLGVGNDGQKDEQRQGVNPPQNQNRSPGAGDKKRGQVGDHQHEDQQGDEAGFPGELLAQPFGPDEEAADEQTENAAGAGQGKDCGKPEIESADRSRGIEKAESKRSSAMVQRNQHKGAEGPEDEGVGQAGRGPLADDFGLKKHLPDEVADALADGKEVKARVLFRFEDFVQDHAEAQPEGACRGYGQRSEEQSFCKREVQRLSQGWERKQHNRTHSRYTKGLGGVVARGLGNHISTRSWYEYRRL